MNKKEILLQLREGTISSDEAKRQLTQLLYKEKNLNNAVEENNIVNKGDEFNTIHVLEITPQILMVKMEYRKDKNTFSIQFLQEIKKIFEDINKNEKYKIIILTGYDNYFACGGSEQGMKAIFEGKYKMSDSKLNEYILDCRIPVIAAMQGHAIGSGLCMGLFCDFIVMSGESMYTCNHMQYGFTPGDGATYILPKKLGFYLGQEMVYTGRRYRGYELKERGTSVNILPKKDVVPYAIEFAKQFENMNLQSLYLLKEHMTAELKKELEPFLMKEWEMQEKTFLKNPATMKKISDAFHMVQELKESNPRKQEYKELIKLNKIEKGKKLFLIHNEGGLEGYQSIAQVCKRPVYGIQSQNRLGSYFNFARLEELASYYIKVMESVQTEEEFDIGGYAAGGMIAYEITRQLQEKGKKVNTLIMIDTFDSRGYKHLVYSEETRMLQAVNMSLMYRTRKEQDDLFPVLINSNDVALDLHDEKLLRHLIMLGKKDKGLSQVKTEDELLELFELSLDRTLMNLIQTYEIKELKYPDQVCCNYYRNKSLSLFGAFSQYFSMEDKQYITKESIYWDEWKSNIVNFNLFDVNATSHITMLFESNAIKELQRSISNLYMV
ncbi:polyketide synthase [Anaeromicropila populeti]|uniref:Enoyl-CoA hydratase/carnithine racemase n=1 Tax=Anaeromicropila populeti TaxID=37658 RepID=A0A1I6IZW8_9FIRM|nr:polyketide synthase [Anaeromicropila populeti]SFR72276.1 Enoyl-CoA hydratase/carnithine racemase [Anaeromicropila populeti]